MTDGADIIKDLGKRARAAAFALSQTPVEAIDSALNLLARRIKIRSVEILTENKKDVEAAVGKGLSAALMDRLTLSPARIDAMAQGVADIRALPDPCGRILEDWTRPSGLRIKKISVPIGVLGMIYESRPNVTVDAAALCLKSRNAVILRGGSDGFHTARALHRMIQETLKESGVAADAVTMVPDTDRALVGHMLAAHEYIDVMIPRGGKDLTRRVMDEARMPVFAHLDGNCHVYVHASANPDVARRVLMNAKMRRTGICGAAESLLLDDGLRPDIAASLVAMLLDSGCVVAGDTQTQALDARVAAASEEDWKTEYLAAKISCKFVSGVRDAVSHINTYGSHHTDSILSEDTEATDYFLKNVDSAIVMHNTSTQFADGGEFGMGAEIGIGTGKLHARGPVGVHQLTTFKYIVDSAGAVRG
jgi:glutamate-5-semialdehyde dehydrogenase